MNPITFNDKFAVAIASHPQNTLAAQFAGWSTAPLFDYETSWDKETNLLGDPRSLTEIASMEWPFETFRLAMHERNVPYREEERGSGMADYHSHYVVRRTQGELHMLIWWRDHRGTKGNLMVHIFTYTDADGAHTGASLYVPKRGGWMLKQRMPQGSVEMIASSAVASLASFLLDCAMPATHIAEVRPCRGNHKVSWQQARTHYTLIAHGHPANKPTVARLARVVVTDDDIKRMAHDRRGHWRTYRHERFTYARGSRRWIKQAWCGPKEWLDAGGKQIYKILEPAVAAEEVLA